MFSVACSLCSETIQRELLALHKGLPCPQRIVSCEYCEFLLLISVCIRTCVGIGLIIVIFVTNIFGGVRGMNMTYSCIVAWILLQSFLVPVFLYGAVDEKARTLDSTSRIARQMSMYALSLSLVEYHPNAPFGYGVCFLNLAIDGFTNATQDSQTARAEAQHVARLENKRMRMMYDIICKALEEVGLEKTYVLQDYLNFFCHGNREAADGTDAS